MTNKIYNSLELREIFHIEFLRWFGRRIRPEHYAVKGGTNLRFFFKSFRYSEDMDIDVSGLSVSKLRNEVLGIINNRSFNNNLKSFGVVKAVPPNMLKAKQTETTQRFKIHLITAAGEDLFTKIEFSRRGLRGGILVQTISETVLRAYKLTPLMAPHYDISSAVSQKVMALASRSSIQARDIFDIYILSSQYDPAGSDRIDVDDAKIKKAYDNIFEVSFEQFRDTVSAYLAPDDQAAYDSRAAWDELKLKTAHFLESLRNKNAQI